MPRKPIKNTCITAKTGKHTICGGCGLKIRSQGKTAEEREETHKKGWHHNNKGYTHR